MKKLIPILVFLFASLGADGQNWNPLNPGVRHYFTNVHGYLKGMRIDSVNAYGNELHYYPFKTQRALSDGYFEWNTNVGGSWLGGDVIKKVDGTFLFPNYWNDTIKLRSLSHIGDSWLFYGDVDSLHYIAQVTDIDTMTVLGLVDSVKKILLTAYYNNTPLASDSFNNTEIILSKQHGFYAIMDLLLFPYYAPGDTLKVDDYYFANSLNRPKIYNWGMYDEHPGKHSCLFHLIDFSFPSMAEINDWNVGDVRQYFLCYGYSTSMFNCDTPGRYSDTIVAKNVYSSGVEYISKTGAHQDTVFYSDTLQIFWHNDRMPEEFDLQFSNKALYYYFPNDSGYCDLRDVYYAFEYQYGLGFYQRQQIYQQGLGMVKNSHYQYYDFGILSNNTLNYCKKGNIECGTFSVPDTVTPVTITNINETTPITIYPNPASEQLTIETSLSRYKLSLVNAVGQVVYNKDGCDNKQVVDVRAFAAGVYQLRIETAEHEVINRKLIIQK